MKRIALLLFLVSITSIETYAQTTGAPPTWQVSSFDLNVNVKQAERVIDVVATLVGVNVGGSAGRTFTVRLNSKAKINSVTANGSPATFRPGQDNRGDLLRAEISLPTSAGPGANATVVVNYTLPVESNTGLAAISPVGTQFLPLSFWYPMPNTPYTVRGADTAPFKLTVNLPSYVSSGVEKPGTFETTLNGQPFFIQGSWDKVDGAADAKNISVLAPKGASADERKQAEAMIAFTAAARAFFVPLLGPAPDVPIRLVAVRRGAGFSDTGTVLFDSDTLHQSRLDAATALSISEAVVRLWIGGQTPIHAEGGGVVRDGLVRFLAAEFLEKQFGRDAVLSELIRERIAFTAVAQRDTPLARANQLDNTYFGSVPNRGAMVWRLIDKRLGRDEFLALLRGAMQAAKSDPNGLSLANLRAALVQRGGEQIKAFIDPQFDQVVDTDLLVGLPQARGAEWVSALRNLGSIDVNVTVAATTDRGEVITAQATVPARNFGEAVFKTSSKIVRVEVDPDKLYPQIEYGNDSAPRNRDLTELLGEAASLLGAQDFVKAETVAREMVTASPRLQEGRILLARALLGQNKLDEAERLFRSALEEKLPFTATLAWANIGLGEISMKRNQPAEAAKFFSAAVFSSRDYPSSLAARAARIRAEAAANNVPAIDPAVSAFATQFSQAIVSGKKADLDAKIMTGELVRFIQSSIGTELWETKVVRTENLSGDLIAADVNIRVNKLGKEGTGPAVLILSKSASGLKLVGIELFEVK